RLAELLPDEAADHLRLAARIAEEAIGDGEAALADWRRVLALAPDDTAAHAAIERLLDATGRVDELADHLRTREADPEVALRLAALLQERLGDVDGALARYERHLDRPAAREGLEAWIRSGAPGAERALRLLDPVLDDV